MFLMEIILWGIILQGKVNHMQIDTVLFEKFKCTIEKLDQCTILWQINIARQFTWSMQIKKLP